MSQRWRRILTLALVFLAASCGEPTNSEDDGRSNENVNERGVPADEVRVLDESARQSVTEFSFDIDDNRGTVRFDPSSDYARNLEQGRIMASRPIEGPAPNGMLQKVQSVDQREDAIVVETRQATLAEAFERADFEVDREMTSEDIERTQTLQPGVSFEKRGQGLEKPFELNFEEVLIDADGDEGTTDDQLKLDGGIKFGASFNVDARIKFLKVKHFSFAANLEESAELEVTGEFDQADFRETKKLSTHNLKNIVFSVAGVPVVIKIDLVIRIGLEGTVHAELQASAEQSVGVRLGAEYNDGSGWDPINEVDSSFNVPPPEVNLRSARARGFAKPRLDITLYGIAGPYLFAKPFVEFDAKRYRSPYWTMKGGLEMGVGFIVKLPIVGEIASWEKDLESFEEQIGESSNKAPDLEVSSPEDGATTTAGESLKFEVAASDREQEMVDVSFEKNGEEAFERSVEGEGAVEIWFNDLCEGTHEFTVTAEDDQGETDSVTSSVIVENAPPEVNNLQVPKLDGEFAGAFPGGYMPATVEIDDNRCSEAGTPDPTRVGWSIDGERIASGSKLLTRLAPDEYAAGDTISLEAKYDDGTATDTATLDVPLRSQPQGDEPPYAEIESCNVCEFVTYGQDGGYRPNEVKVEGRGVDQQQGPLSGSSLVWEVKPDRGSRQQVGTGESATFQLDEVFQEKPTPNETHDIILTVEDSSGNTDEVRRSFSLYYGR